MTGSSFLGFRKLQKTLPTRDISGITPSFYDRTYLTNPEYAGPPEDARWFDLWSLVLTGVSSNDVVLDLGCGTGQLAKMAEDKGIKGYTGLDWSPVAIAKARARCPSYQFAIIDLNNHDLVDTKIRYVHPDIILAIEVLEHLGDDCGLLGILSSDVPIRVSLPTGPAYSHARWFEKAEDVFRRYGRVLIIESLRSVGKDWWYLTGKRRE